MKTTVLSVLAATLLIAGLAAPVHAQEAEAIPAPAADVEAVQIDQAVEIPACAGTLAAAPVLELGAAWHCPYGAPHCFKDDHCDSYCGDPRFGYCFSNGCCGCSG